MSSGKRTLLRLAGIAAFLAVVAVVALLILVHDESLPPDDSDLVLVRPEVPAERNAWTYYVQAGEKLDLPRWGEDETWSPAPKAAAPAPAADKSSEKTPEPDFGDPAPTARSRWDDIVSGTAWEQPLVDAVLARNAETLVLWEKGLAAPESLLPEAKGPAANIDWLYPPLDLASLVTVRARNLARQGNDEASMEDALRLVRFGHQAQEGKGVLIGYLMGATLKGMGLDLMRDLVRESRLSPQRFRRAAAEVAAYPAEPRALAETLKAEYAFCRSGLDGIIRGEVDLEPLAILTGTQMRVSAWERFFFKPNRTRRLLSEAYREMIAAAPKHFSDLPVPDKFHAVALEEQKFAGGNIFGGMLLDMEASGVVNAHGLRCQTSAELSATRVLLAMKAFKMEKQRLPATLNELVPEYLDTVPLDDFDGNPFRYSPAKNLIYSVGKDLKDEGGTTKQEYIEAQMKDRSIDLKAATPEELKDIESQYPWLAADLSFLIEF